MLLTIAEICSFTESTPSCRNFKKGEQKEQSNHILYCGKRKVDESGVHFLAFCMASTKMSGKPHEINGIISEEGIIIDITCSCKAGLSKKCKHCVAVLMHLTKKDVTMLNLVSCTDTKALWKNKHANVLDEYAPRPLFDHDCLKEKFEQGYSVEVTEENREKINKLLINDNEMSAIYKHKCGRHDPLNIPENQNTYVDKDFIKMIISAEPSETMRMISTASPEKPSKVCCQNILNSLQIDCEIMCLETINNKKEWRNQRQYRITGSRCYSLFTYTKNRTPDWKKKSLDYFYPKKIKTTKPMKHGLREEDAARLVYEKHTGVTVYQTGLVVSSTNPWLAYTPDGITLNENKKPATLIEIKCPFDGKDSSIEEIVDKVEFLDKTNHFLKTKHKYYGQIQLGMAILNVRETDFIVYASFDCSFMIITVPYDESFTSNMLLALKKVYYNTMLYHICENGNSVEESE